MTLCGAHGWICHPGIVFSSGRSTRISGASYADELLRSAGGGSLPEAEIARANDALGLWVPELRVVLINESHSAFDGLDDPTLTYDLSRVAWHEWGHALSIDRAGRRTSRPASAISHCCPMVSRNSSDRRATVVANIRTRSSPRSTRS
jgi:hypothetical protein